tara:strand:- start:2196 stop:2594 length:399 start_codon:yes stop_codon:yes gene_type:complete
MATTTATISLISAAGDLLTDALTLSDATSITASHTTGLARKKVTATAVHATATVLYTADDFAASPYLYIKNTAASATEYIWVYEDEGSDRVILKMGGGDWAFMPLKGDTTMKAYAPSSNDPVVEFMVIGTDQ